MTRDGETPIEPPPAEPGARAVDDHVAGSAPGGGTQPTDDLDRGVATEHLSSPAQGARPEGADATGGDEPIGGGGEPIGGGPGGGDEPIGGGPSGDEDAGDGPAFEE